MGWCRSSLTPTVTCARSLQNRATQNDGSWTDGRTDRHTAGGALPGLTAVVQTLLSCPSRSQVTSTGGHSQVVIYKVSHVHVVRVWRAGRLGLLLGLPPRLPPYKLVVVLQLLLPLLFVIHLLRASSLGEKKMELSMVHFYDLLGDKNSPLLTKLVLANTYQVAFTQTLNRYSNHYNHWRKTSFKATWLLPGGWWEAPWKTLYLLQSTTGRQLPLHFSVSRFSPQFYLEWKKKHKHLY